MFSLQVQARELDDNLKLRQKIEEENNICKEISELSTKIGGMDLQRVMREKEELKKKEETILKDVSITFYLTVCITTVCGNITLFTPL